MEFMPINICTVVFGSTKMFIIICGNLSDGSAVTIITAWRHYTEYIFCLKNICYNKRWHILKHNNEINSQNVLESTTKVSDKIFTENQTNI
jgi:hypothetical protein